MQNLNLKMLRYQTDVKREVGTVKIMTRGQNYQVKSDESFYLASEKGKCELKIFNERVVNVCI